MTMKMKHDILAEKDVRAMNVFTAHKREVDGSVEIQTVFEHSRGTANLAERYAEKIDAPAIARLQGMIHDAGKLCRDFDDYILEKNNFTRGMIDHCYAGARYLIELAKKTGEKKMIETARFISHTVISHHGLHDWIDKDGNDYFRKRISKDERYEEIQSNLLEMLSEQEWLKLLYAAKDEYMAIREKIAQIGGKEKVPFAFYMGQFERLMQSVLVDADRTNTADFQEGKVTEAVFEEKIWELLSEKVEETCKKFCEQKDPISKLRCDISERCRCYAEQETEICRMIVPTGGGKTISSLRFAIHYCRKHGKERIFYIAPFRTILEQNCEEWKRIVGEAYVLEHHSDMIALFKTEEEITQYELRVDKWDVPIIATTLVQFMNTFFSNRMDSVRRMHRLCNSVIIIDEIQSIPAECVSLFNLGVNFISTIGKSTVVLCSATQPALEKVKYPLRITDSKGYSMTGDYSGDFLAFKRNEIISALRKSGYTYVEAAKFCMEKYRTEGTVLFVVNTKAAAFEIYQELCKQKDSEMILVHLSANMCPEHRRILIKDLKEKLKEGKVICVTTQLIEAGVDISFRCVIRSLAGMDNVTQAAGRCNREGKDGACCSVYLLNLCEERIGTLKTIKTAQDVSRQLIESNDYEDLTSVEAMELYFQKYYMECKNDLGYNVEDIGVNTDLVNLLSLNEYRNCGKQSYRVQAFKTAGELFKMIDVPTTSVIVPYNEEAKDLTARLRSETSNYEIIKILRQAQKYAVGLSEKMKKKLEEEKALELFPCGVWVLEEGYYDQNAGIMLKESPMDLLIS